MSEYAEALNYAHMVKTESDGGRYDAPKTALLARALLEADAKLEQAKKLATPSDAMREELKILRKEYEGNEMVGATLRLLWATQEEREALKRQIVPFDIPEADAKRAYDICNRYLGDVRGELDGEETLFILRTLRELIPDTPFQKRVAPWMQECFGPVIAADKQERNHRFIEESLELVQSCGATASECHQLVDYVFGRPAGDRGQEVGGVMVTLAALCLANGLDMHSAGEIELRRIWGKIGVIREKQANKPKHSPLPEVVDQKRAPPELTGSGQFTCPRCGSHQWGTSRCTEHKSLWIGHCHGLGCKFNWKRDTEDILHFEQMTVVPKRLSNSADIQITLRQVRELHKFFGGEDAEMSVGWLEGNMVKPDAETDPPSPSGLYVWCTDYPDEGVAYLGETEVDDTPQPHPPRCDMCGAIAPGARA